MALCCAVLIASEFMPVSLLTPIALDLHMSEGQVGQEAMHGREHDRFNQALIKKGFDVETGVKSISKGLGLLKKLTPIQQLACTVVMEHATAHLAIQWLSHADLNRLSDPKTLAMWQWHALEELEHKTVSYDVYKMLNEDQWITRFIAVCAVMGVVLPVSIYAAIVIAYKHGSHKNREEFIQGLKLLFGQDGFLRPLMTKAPDFLKKDFNPRNDDTVELEKIWREKLLGKNGVLNQFYRNNNKLAK
jgi:predicted metal-dependent hydrolase